MLSCCLCRDLAADLLMMIPDNKLPLIKLCAFYSGCTAERNDLHEKVHWKSIHLNASRAYVLIFFLTSEYLRPWPNKNFKILSLTVLYVVYLILLSVLCTVSMAQVTFTSSLWSPELLVCRVHSLLITYV